MKHLLVGMGILLCSFNSEAKKSNCPDELITAKGTRKKIEVVRLWEKEVIREPNRIPALNGALVWEVAELCKRSHRFPTAQQLSSKLKAYSDGDEEGGLLDQAIEEIGAYFKKKGTPGDLKELVSIAAAEMPDAFEGFRTKATKAMAGFFKKRFRLPTEEELAQAMKVELAYLNAVIPKIEVLWQADGVQLEAAEAVRNKLLAAFIRAATQRDLPHHLKIQASTPDMQAIVGALIRTSGNKDLQSDYVEGVLTNDYLFQMMGEKSDGIYAPILFEGGIAQMEKEAKLFRPTAFKSYVSDLNHSLAHAEEAALDITEKGGFLVTSVTAGVPLDEGQLAIMKKISKEKGYPILLMPTNQIVGGLDKKLLDDPGIRIITNTIMNSFLKVWQIPILARNKNPFASVDQRGQFVPGQTVIVGHPQLAHKIVPTSSNEVRDTALWSPGSVSVNLYPYRHAVQGRTSALARNYHSNSFLVVEKADRKAGLMGEGIQNFWHVRPVEYIDDTGKGGVAGVTDLGIRYTVDLDDLKVQKSKQDPAQLVVGDLHDWVSDQQMMGMYADLIDRFPGLRDVHIHDPIDGYSHNHHESKNYNLLLKKFKQGDLDFHREMMGLVQVANAFLARRENIRVVFPDSNHSYWGRRLVYDHPETQLVINGSFITELSHAANMLGMSDPLEYVFQHRHHYIEGLPEHVKLKLQQIAIPVSDPKRVQVVPFGKQHVVGPKHRPVHLNFHGHQGTNGARGSINSHANSSANLVVGDSHQSAILGGLINVGTSTTKKVGYNDGGYSSWNNSCALIYPDGSKQLITYSSLAGTFQQRAENGVLGPDAFFGDEPLEVVPTSNQLLPKAEVMDTHSLWLDIVYGKGSTDRD